MVEKITKRKVLKKLANYPHNCTVEEKIDLIINRQFLFELRNDPNKRVSTAAQKQIASMKWNGVPF